MTSAIGLGVGGVFVSLALIYLLAYFNIVDSTGVESTSLKRFVAASVVPVAVTFAGIVAFQTLQIV